MVVLPWLLRNAWTFGSPFPGSVLENALIRRNTDVFAYLDRPTLSSFLEQGAAAMLGNPLAAAWHQLVE